MSLDLEEFDKKSFEEELIKIDITDIKSLDLEYLYYSPADIGKNKNAYDFVNKILLEIIHEKDKGRFIHITGEMKALADVTHRNCINELYELNELQFEIVFSLPEGTPLNSANIKRYNKDTWKASWIDHIESFDILSEKKANLYNKHKRILPQYSLFGDRLILFQSNHKPREYVKKVWVINSKSLFKILEVRANDIIKNQSSIQSIIFLHFNSSLSTTTTLHLLHFLYDNDDCTVDRYSFNREEKNIDPFSKFKLENLINIGFIEDWGTVLKLSDDGQEYLKLFI